MCASETDFYTKVSFGFHKRLHAAVMAWMVPDHDYFSMCTNISMTVHCTLYIVHHVQCVRLRMSCVDFVTGFFGGDIIYRTSIRHLILSSLHVLFPSDWCRLPYTSSPWPSSKPLYIRYVSLRILHFKWLGIPSSALSRVKRQHR